MENAAPMIYPAMAAIMSEIPAIGKDKKNTTQGFNYRGIDDVYNALNSVMGKHGVFMCPEVMDQSREERTNKNGTVLAFVTLRVKYHFYAKDGSSVSCTVCGEGMDSGDKATNKAMSIAQKYAFFQAFCIPTKEVVDPDAESHEIKPKPATHPASDSTGNGDAPSDKQRKAFFASVNKTMPWLKGDRDGILEVLSLVFSRNIASSNELSSSEMSRIISDPGVLLEFGPSEKEYQTSQTRQAADEGDGPPITPATLQAIEKELTRLGVPGQLPPDIVSEYDTGDPSELTEPQGRQALAYLKNMKP